MPFISKEQKENIMSLTAFVIVPFKVFTDFPAENMMHSFLKFCRFSGPEIGRKEKLNSFYANEEHYKLLRILMLIISVSHISSLSHLPCILALVLQENRV